MTNQEEKFSVGFLLFAVGFFFFGLITLSFIFGGLWSEMAKMGVASFPTTLSILACFFGWVMIRLALRPIKRLAIKRIGYILISVAFFIFVGSVLNSTLPIAHYVILAALFLSGHNLYLATTVSVQELNRIQQ